MDWKELLKAFTDAVADAVKDLDDAKKAALLAEATNALPQEARQYLHDAAYADGEKKGKTDSGTDTAAKDREIATLKKQATAKDAEIVTLKETNPDVAKIKSEYETRLTEKDTELEAVKTQGKTEVAAERKRAATGRINAGLAGRVVSPAIARALAADPELAKRLQFDDDGTARVYQTDGKTPLALKAGADPIDALVEDVASGLDKSLLKSVADGGSGASGGAAGDASEFDAIREEVRQQYAAPTDAAQQDRFNRL